MTSKHNSWVWLKDSSYLRPIIPLFPKGIPVRDPFPMKISFEDNRPLALWQVDVQRMEFSQRGAFCQYLANGFQQTRKREPSHQEIIDKWLLIPNNEIGYLEVGKEGMVRHLELYIFMYTSLERDLGQFYDNQFRRWIKGNESPDEVVENLDDSLLAEINSSEFKELFRPLDDDSRHAVPMPPLGAMIQGEIPGSVTVVDEVIPLEKFLTANLN